MAQKILISGNKQEDILVLAKKLQDQFLTTTAILDKVLDIIPQEQADLILLDIAKLDKTATNILKQIHSLDIIIITPSKEISKIQKNQEIPCLAKPYNLEALKQLIAKTLKEKLLKRENIKLRHKLHQESLLGNFIGISSAAKQIQSQIQKIAANDAPLIIEGPLGTEKETIAYEIHRKSSRGVYSFQIYNCINKETFLEDLLGEEKKQTTTPQYGLLRMLENGTLVLHNIEQLSTVAQNQLADLIKTKVFSPLRTSKKYPLTIRIIATSDVPLDTLVKNNLFSPQLSSLLKQTIEIPPLSLRARDIPLIAENYLQTINNTLHTSITGFSEDALLHLSLHDWPGNTQELKLMLKQICLLQEKGTVTLTSLPLKIINNFRNETQPLLPRLTEAMVKRFTKTESTH